jgi:type I restriction enzyme S subunit
MREPWRYVKVRDVVAINPDVIRADEPEREFRYIDIGSVAAGSIDWRQTDVLSSRRAPSRAQRRVAAGDVLFGNVRPQLRSHGYIPNVGNDELVASTGFAVLRTTPAYDDRLLYHVVLGANVLGQARRAEVGSSYPAVNERDVGSFVIPLPPVREQRRIAEILDSVDESIRCAEYVIRKLQSAEAGLIRQLVPSVNGDTSGSRSAGDGVALRPLGEVADVDRGRFTHRPRNDPRFYGGDYPFIQTGDVARHRGRYIGEASQSLNELGRKASLLFPSGTIAVTIAANIADTAILAGPMCFPDSVVGVQVKAPNEIRYVELCIRLAKPTLEARAPQSAQKNINLQDLRPLKIPIPHPDKQNRIGQIYEEYIKRVAGDIARRDKLLKLKQGLMEDLLTGRVRVNGEREATA